MVGLITKDLLLIKQNLKTLLIVLFVFTIMTFNGMFDITFMLPFITIMLFITTFSYDDYNKWNAYAITLPCKRKNIVKSKYIAGLILIILSTVIGFIMSIIIAKINNKFDMDTILPSMVGCILGISIIISVMFPMIFKFGSEKGRIWLFLGLFGIGIVGGTLSKVVDLSALLNILEVLESYWFIITPISITVLLIISYLISRKIYLKKEF